MPDRGNRAGPQRRAVMHRDLGAGRCPRPETNTNPIIVSLSDAPTASPPMLVTARSMWGHDAFAPHLLFDGSAVDEFIHPGKLPVADRFVHTALTIALKGAAKRADTVRRAYRSTNSLQGTDVSPR